MSKIQNLSLFNIPENFRGRSKFMVQLWWIVQSLIFKNSPQIAYKFRVMVLKIFGAKIGSNVLIRPTVTITYPWKLNIGNNSWIGDEVILYSLGTITIGENSVVSQRSYICTGDHDHNNSTFPIRSFPVIIGNECWIATDTFIAPGITIGSGTVVGARSSVFSDLPPGMLCFGSPCKPVKPRKDPTNQGSQQGDRI